MSLRRNPSDVLMPWARRLIFGAILVVLTLGILTAAGLVALDDARPQPGIQRALHDLPEPAKANPEHWSRRIGRVFGLLAATLVLLQFTLSAKLKFLDRVFGLHRVLYFHQSLGLLLVILASLHPMFMFAPTNAPIGPFRLAIWPKLLGMLLLIGLWTGVCIARWRRFLGMEYQGWYFLHRLGMFSLVVVLILHLLSVNRDFHHGGPLYGLVAALFFYACLFFWIIVFKPRRLKKRTYTVSKNEHVGRNTHMLTMVPDSGEVFLYAPGQFAFVSFLSGSLPVERHHWTISSAPTRAESLAFTIKCSGDFTALIGDLKPGDRASVDGPYGLFTYLAGEATAGRELIMIAGGIGITPIFSMLRYMVDTADSRKVTLIWSNRTEVDILCRQELEEIKNRLSNLSVHHILTRANTVQSDKGRLNGKKLKELLSGSQRDAAAFICGPPVMMNSVCASLKSLGFKHGRIHMEKFSY